MTKSKAITIENEFSKVSFLADRTPETTSEQAEGSFALLSEYRDGGVYIMHYSGFSEWERHPQGDEFVQVISGETQLVLLQAGEEQYNQLFAGQILVIPQGVWYRFESPLGVKVMTITPQPTEHSVKHPNKIKK